MTIPVHAGLQAFLLPDCIEMSEHPRYRSIVEDFVDCAYFYARCDEEGQGASFTSLTRQFNRLWSASKLQH